MSIEAAIGAIDQIYQLQQQVQSPAAFLASQNASPSGGAALTGAQSTTFAAQLANAQGLSSAIGSTTSSSTDPTATGALDPSALASGALGSSALGGATAGSGATALGLLSAAGYGSAAGVAGATGTGLTTSLSGAATPTGAVQAAGASDPRIAAMVNTADSLIGKPYVWGGGHSGWGPQAGYDCSGFVSAVLHAGGYLSSPQDTQTLPSQAGIEAGPGQYVTIYDRTDAGGADHVIINIGGQFYESGGEHGAWGGGGGVAKIGTPSASYLATFNQVLHPAGL